MNRACWALGALVLAIPAVVGGGGETAAAPPGDEKGGY
jgi:hypothetical protein